MSEGDVPEIPLVSTAEAIAEVRRWLEVDGIDPERIFAAAGDQVVRYKDLIGHLERGTADGEMLRFAISRGRLIRQDRAEMMKTLLSIEQRPRPPGDRGGSRAPGVEKGAERGAPGEDEPYDDVEQ